MKEAVLLDGHSIIYRSFYAFIRNPLRNSKGQNTSAVFGFANSLRKLFNKFQPEYGCVAFDAKGETFRHKEFDKYKIQRPPAPDELHWQVPLIKELVEAYGLDVIEIQGYEADDVLGSLALDLKNKGYRVIIVSFDKDLFQLVGNNIYVYDSYKDILYDSEEVLKKYGVPPERISDLLALAGDTIDNIPGVPGIGEKRAAELISKYKSLEEALEKEEKLKKFTDLALFSKSLTSIKTDIKLKKTTLSIREPQTDRLIKIFRKLEFSSLLKEIVKLKEEKVEIKEIDKIKPYPEWGFYLDPPSLFLSRGSKEAYRIEKGGAVREFLEDPNCLKIGFDMKNQMKEEEIREPIFDVKIASWLYEPNKKKYELPDLLLGQLELGISEISRGSIAFYSWELFKVMKSKIKNFKKVFYEIEMPLIPVLTDMERRGVKIDTRVFKEFSHELSIELKEIKKGIYSEAGCEFNLNSPKQISHILFEILKLKPLKRTKTGYSTDVSVLSELARSHKVPREMLRYRELSKLKSTYLDPLMELADPDTRRIHTTFNQTGTSTGRLSSSNPNLQNIPVRGDMGKRVRKGFIAEEGSLLLSCDYSQIELRILASVSKDERLKQAFLAGEDIHTRTACEVLGITEKEITEEARRIAKVVNYGVIYGMSDFGLSQELGISKEEAQAFIERYMLVYPKVAQWREEAVKRAEERGYAETIFGRQRPIPELQSKPYNLYEAGRRLAINAPVQGSAADIIKLAMIRLYNRLKEEGFKGGIILQIHDELLLEIEEDRVEEAKEIIKEEMEKGQGFDVPLTVNIGVGKNWGEAH